MTRGFEQLKESPPEYYRIAKQKMDLPRYMSECLDGADHPLQIEYDNYVRTMIGVVRMQREFQNSNYGIPDVPEEFMLSDKERHLIESFSERREVNWAVHNSFDGLYIQKQFNHGLNETIFNFAVYLKEENKTFWMLKYRGDARL